MPSNLTVWTKKYKVKMYGDLLKYTPFWNSPLNSQFFFFFLESSDFSQINWGFYEIDW